MEKEPVFTTIENLSRDPLKPPIDKKKRKKMNRLLNFYIAAGFFLLLGANIILASPILLPYLYGIFPQASANELESLSAGIEADKVTIGEIIDDQPDIEVPIEEEDPLPPIDENLPDTNLVRIPKIAVNAKIVEGADHEAALQQGSWIANDFGTPENPIAPIIIASHRWGGLGWTQQQRNDMSFYRLPETTPGDRIEVVWNKRLYTYEIYHSEENTEITDYSADLVLYTCKVLWQSPVRIFRYAKLIPHQDINSDNIQQ